MRNRNWTYRGIARVLTEKCGIRVSPSNLHHFVKHHLLMTAGAEGECSAMGSFRKEASPDAHAEPATRISKRIETLNHHSEETSQEKDIFEFDPAVPLRLPTQKNKV